MPRRGRRRSWVVVPDGAGRYDVLYDNRPVAQGIADAAARALIKRRRQTRDGVFLEEQDGYRVRVRLSDITEQQAEGVNAGRR